MTEELKVVAPVGVIDQDAVTIADPANEAIAESSEDKGFVVNEADGMNLLKLKDQCVTILRGCGDSISDMEEAPIYLPTFAVKGTKYNKIRLIPEEAHSPMGIIQRNNEYADKYTDMTCGKFKAIEVLSWLFERTGGEIA